MAPLVISPPLSFHYSGGFRGGARGAQTAPPRPLFLDQTEAQRAEKNFFGDRPPPLFYLRVWMTPPSLSQGLDLPLHYYILKLT